MQKSQVSRRDFLKVSTALGISATIPHNLMAAAQDVSRKPNIILIMADDLGYECIGANGGTSYKTPVLDQLADGGVRFKHCYAQPLCTPSRVKLMTGIYNVRNYVKFGVLDRNQTTFAHLLKKAGYASCVVGKWQLGRQSDSPKHFGFDESCLWQHTRRPGRYPNPGLEINGKQVNYQNGEYGPDVVSDFACDFMKRNKGKPFFVYYPMILTHCPFEPTPDSPDWDPKSKGSKSYKGSVKYFGDMVTYMDKIVGKLIAKLEDLGLRKNTLVLFTGDNGTDNSIVSMINGKRIAGQKGQMTDAGTRVPLIANWPGVVPPKKVCTDIVDFSDFMPTLCECGSVLVPQELNIDGRSFMPQLRGKKGNPREWIYCWYSRDGNSRKAKEFARNQRYKLYRTGKLYDIRTDVPENKNLPTGNLDREARRIRTLLQEALDRYKNARPPALRSQPKRKKSRVK